MSSRRRKPHGYLSLDNLIMEGSRHPSGLLLPPEALGDAPPLAQRLTRLSALPVELRPAQPDLIVPASAVPQPSEMVLVTPTATDLELPTPSLTDARELIAEVPFESAMLLLSLIAAELHHHPNDRDRQRLLARELYRGRLLERVERFVASDRQHVFFDPRHVSALQRLLVAYAAPDGAGGGLSDAEVDRVVGALLAVASTLPHGDPPEQEPSQEPDWTGWAAYTARAGAWYSEPYILEGLARAHSLYAAVHRSEAVAEHAARCDLDAWMAEDYGLSVEQQLAGGLACAVLARALDADLGIRERAVHVEPGFLCQGALAAHEDEIVRLISATRAELAALLRADSEDPMRIAWDHTVFEQRPFLRLYDGTMRLISPRALVAWLTRGMHHRALQAAKRRKHPNKPDRSMSSIFLTYAGALGEESVRQLTSRAMRTATRAGVVHAHGEHSYRIGKRRIDSPDLALDFGPDLVLIEVYSGRIALRARAGQGPELLRRAIDKATTDKLGELAARIHELLEGQLTYAEVELTAVRCIWPVLVLAGDPVFQTPMLWNYLRKSTPESFLEDPRVRRPVICHLDDLEPLFALVEQGHHLPELLSEYVTSLHAEMPPRNWICWRFGVPLRPAYIDEQYHDAMANARQVLFSSAFELQPPD